MKNNNVTIRIDGQGRIITYDYGDAPSLKDLCLDVMYRDLISKATPSTAEYVRDGLDCWQGVTKGRRGEKDFREECIKKFNKSHFSDELDIPLHVYAVLDCLLTDNLTVLKLQMPYQIIKSLASLMNVIARRSPKLKDLVIKFYKTSSVNSLLEKPPPNSPPTKKMNEPSNSNIYLLQDLTSLSLICKLTRRAFIEGSIDEPSPEPIPSIVGERCPALEKLLVRGFRCRKQDILGLILGNVADVLFPLDNEGWSEDTVLESLWIPQEFMSPLCFTLQQLEVYCSCQYPTKCTHPPFSISTYAFVLRHLRNLHYIKYLRSGSFLTRPSPRLLEVLKSERVECQQAEFEEACLGLAATYVGLQRNLTGPLSYFSGPISLRCLLDVLIDDIEMIREVGTIFPNATDVSFVGNMSYSGRINTSAHSSTAEHSSLFDDDEIYAILRECFPNVESIGIVEIECRACVKQIIKAFGSRLKSVEFIDCSELDLLDLIPCNILESLLISDDCSILVNASGSLEIDQLISLPFLPSLKKFSSYSCLGIWSSLFESKTSLTELQLNCSHIGKGELPRLEWSQIPELWKTVEKLNIGSCSGLTLTVLAEHFSKLTSLKYACVPKSITANETHQHIDEILQRLLDRKTSVVLLPDSLFEFHWTVCDFQA